MLSNVQVQPGASSVARTGDVLVWFETGPSGGGEVLPQLLQAVQAVAAGEVLAHQMGAHLAAVLNGGDAEAVPALAAATPEDGGLRVVVHGWGAVVADGVRVPNGWVDQLVTDRRAFFLGRNTVTPLAPSQSSALDLEDGVVPGDGVSFSLAGAPGSASPAAAGGSTAVTAAADTRTPIAWPPPPAPTPSRPPMPTPAPLVAAEPALPAPPPAGRLVLDDGSIATLERTCVLGSAPSASPAVQTGVAVPLTVIGPGVAGVHAEVRVDAAGVSVRDLGSATTHLLAPGTLAWVALAPGQVAPVTPGTRIALGQRTFSYEQP